MKISIIYAQVQFIQDKLWSVWWLFSSSGLLISTIEY